MVLAPAGVSAATGSLTTLVDPLLPNRKVRVGSAGALQVETRPGVTSGAFNVDTGWAGADPSYWKVLASGVGPTRLTLSEVTMKLDGGDPARDVPLRLASYTQFAGDETACGPGVAGYARAVLRTLSVKASDPMVQILFSGPPLIAPAAPQGMRTCLVWEWITLPPEGATFSLGATGFRYS
jgi:hypothetical protein